MEHTGAGGAGDEVENSDPAVDVCRNGGIQSRLAERAGDGEQAAETVEFVDLCARSIAALPSPRIAVFAYLAEIGNLGEETAQNGMQTDIGPAADGIDGRVLPRLQPVAMREVVRGLPVVEDCSETPVRQSPPSPRRIIGHFHLHRSRGLSRRRRRVTGRGGVQKTR